MKENTKSKLKKVVLYLEKNNRKQKVFFAISVVIAIVYVIFFGMSFKKSNVKNNVSSTELVNITKIKNSEEHQKEILDENGNITEFGKSKNPKTIEMFKKDIERFKYVTVDIEKFKKEYYNTVEDAKKYDYDTFKKKHEDLFNLINNDSEFLKVYSNLKEKDTTFLFSGIDTRVFKTVLNTKDDAINISRNPKELTDELNRLKQEDLKHKTKDQLDNTNQSNKK